MSKAPAKPSQYAIRRLSRETGQAFEICEAAYIEAKCIYNAALSILRGKQTPLKYIPVTDEPPTVRFDGTLTNGNVIRPGMTLTEIDNAVTYPRPTGNAVADRARRLAAKLSREARTPEQIAAFDRAHRSTYLEVLA